MYHIPIYDQGNPNPKRIFDVETNDAGDILRYLTQNIKGHLSVTTEDIQIQINEFIRNNK